MIQRTIAAGMDYSNEICRLILFDRLRASLIVSVLQCMINALSILSVHMLASADDTKPPGTGTSLILTLRMSNAIGLRALRWVAYIFFAFLA